MSALDPFYLVKEEIQDSVNKVQATFVRWEQLPPTATERGVLINEIVSGYESIEWQVDELDKATGVAERDPARFSVDTAEIDRRKKWTASTRSQIKTIRGVLQAASGKTTGTGLSNGTNGRRELLRMEDRPESKTTQTVHDSFLANESDRQALIIREQDEDLDELSASVERLGGVGLTIHEELSGQERIIDDLAHDMNSTSTRLEFVQKRLAIVMKKAGWKGQVMMIVFLVVLLIILTFLVVSA